LRYDSYCDGMVSENMCCAGIGSTRQSILLIVRSTTAACIVAGGCCFISRIEKRRCLCYTGFNESEAFL